MIILNEHIVDRLETKIRFIDYCIGIFPQTMTKNAVKKAIKRKELLINNLIASTGRWMKEGDFIQLIDTENRNPKSFPLDVPIVFEDDFLVIVNKPSGISVSGNLHRTLENAMIGKVKLSSQIDALKWAKPVHRLDLATSGLVILSKTAATHRKLAKLFEHRMIEKEYHAVIMGRMELDNGVINDSIQQLVAITKFQQLKTIPSLRSGELTLIKLLPKTGRTHQLRIHCSNKGCPIVGDTIYGEEKNVLLHKGLFLSATRLQFEHPMNDEAIDISIDLPYKFLSLLEREKRRWEKFNSLES